MSKIDKVWDQAVWNAVIKAGFEMKGTDVTKTRSNPNDEYSRLIEKNKVEIDRITKRMAKINAQMRISGIDKAYYSDLRARWDKLYYQKNALTTGAQAKRADAKKSSARSVVKNLAGKTYSDMEQVKDTSDDKKREFAPTGRIREDSIADKK